MNKETAMERIVRIVLRLLRRRFLKIKSAYLVILHPFLFLWLKGGNRFDVSPAALSADKDPLV
jgi:hypothetical protein